MRVLDLDTLEACHGAVVEKIQRGPLSGDGCDETAERNGIIMAANVLALMLDVQMLASRPPLIDAVPMTKQEISFRRYEANRMYGDWFGSTLVDRDICLDGGLK